MNNSSRNNVKNNGCLTERVTHDILYVVSATKKTGLGTSKIWRFVRLK